MEGVLVLLLTVMVGLAAAGDINRQSIVFYEATPDVFYCPQEKPISLEGEDFDHCNVLL